MPIDDDDIWCDGPVIIDEAARRLTVPPGAQSSDNYGDLLGLVRTTEALARLRKFLKLAHRCRETICVIHVSMMPFDDPGGRRMDDCTRRQARRMAR